ncbi:MAG: pterin-binding domain-containing protein [Candidatus Syntropharchaeia archaeon]
MVKKKVISFKKKEAAPVDIAALQLPPFEFKNPVRKWEAKFGEVTIGATKENGGTRAYTITIGGNDAPPFYKFEGSLPHRPPIAHVVFDEDPGLPKRLKEYYEDVKDDPVAWAKKSVNEYGAKMISLDLNSTDPKGTNRSAEEAAETVKEVLKAVDTPLAISTRSGNMKKDVEVLEECAKVAEGENLLITSTSMIMPTFVATPIEKEVYEYFNVCKNHDHTFVAYQSMNITNIIWMASTAANEGVKKEKIVLDPGVVAVGYAAELAVSTIEGIVQKTMIGDRQYGYPIIAAPANAWIVREAYAGVSEWGPAEKRGTMLETALASYCLVAGAHLLIMLDQEAIRMTEELLDRLYAEEPPEEVDWIKVV